MHDLDAAWRELEDAERNREVALVQELDRQEKLEQLAERFDKKASLRESWLDDMSKVGVERRMMMINYGRWKRFGNFDNFEH